MLYLMEIYFKLHAFGHIAFYFLIGLVGAGGIGLLVAMADNGKKGSLDFSREYMSERAAEYSTLIVLWKRALSLLVIVAIVAVFAPSREVVTNWTTPTAATVR